MKRKILSAILAVTAAVSFCIGAACASDGELKAEFVKDFPKEVYLSRDIDLEDYIVPVDGAEAKVTVQYYSLVSDKTVSETFSGHDMVFYPKTIGEHVLVYEVKKGRKTSSASETVQVIADPPTITISHTAQTIPMPESGQVERSYEYLLSNASMFLKPMTAETKITAAEFRGVTVGLDSINQTWQPVELDEEAETFVFSQIGEYRFFVRATSEDNYSEDYFLVNVIKDPTDGTKKSDGITPVIEKGKGVVYDENDPYTFKIMSSNISDINYAVVADPLDDGKKLSLVFKGKNAPQLGFYVVADEGSEDEYNIKTTKGGFFSFVAKESSGHKWVFFFPNMLTGNAARTPIPGVNDFGLDDFENDKYYLMQYSLSQVTYVDAREAWRLKVNVEIFEAVSYSTAGEKSACVIGDKLHEIGIEGEFYYYDGDKENGFDFSIGKSVIYGDIRNNIDVQYIPDEKNITRAPKTETLVEGTDNVYSYNSSVTVNAGGSISANLKKGKITDDLVAGIYDELGYVGIVDSGFGMGATVTVDFEGKNLPGIGLYLGNSPEGYAVGGASASGTGFYIGNGNVCGEQESSAIMRRLIVNGPDRLDPGGTYRGNNGYPPYFGRVDGLSYFGSAAEGEPDYNKCAEMGYALLEDGKKYRFQLTDVSAQADSDKFSKFSLNYKLYDTSGDTPVLIVDVTKTVDRSAFGSVNFKSQTIAFFGSIRQNIRFTVSVSGDVIEYPYDNEPLPDAITLAPATVTEIRDGSTVVGYTGTYDYQGLGVYKVGDVLEFYFTGKNIPNVGLFVNKNGVNPIGGGTENTGLFLQTSGHGTSTFDKRLYITGPFLVDAGSEDAYRTIAGLESYAYKTELGKNKELAVDISNTGNTSLFGIAMLEDGVDYVYRITTEAAGSAAQVVIKCALYSVSGDERTLLTEISKTVTHYLPTLENTYAVVYGAGDYSKRTISFTYAVNP